MLADLKGFGHPEPVGTRVLRNNGIDSVLSSRAPRISIQDGLKPADPGKPLFSAGIFLQFNVLMLLAGSGSARVGLLRSGLGLWSRFLLTR